MATLVIPDLDERALERARAALHAEGSSIEAEIRDLIEQRAHAALEHRRAAEEAIAELREYRERMFAIHGQRSNTTEWLRQERRSW